MIDHINKFGRKIFCTKNNAKVEKKTLLLAFAVKIEKPNPIFLFKPKVKNLLSKFLSTKAFLLLKTT